MDPLSITASALALLGTCIKGLDLVCQYATEFKLAELKALEMRIECGSVRRALRQIQNQLRLDSALDEEEDLCDLFYDCKLVFGLLSQNLKPILAENEPGSTLGSRIAGLRHTHEATVLLSMLGSLSRSLALILQWQVPLCPILRRNLLRGGMVLANLVVLETKQSPQRR